MTVHADTTLCIGAGQCALRAPAVFDQNEHDGTVMVLNTEPNTQHEEAVREAIALCPSGAISITGR
jgi:ferredoxin